MVYLLRQDSQHMGFLRRFVTKTPISIRKTILLRIDSLCSYKNNLAILRNMHKGQKQRRCIALYSHIHRRLCKGYTGFPRCVHPIMIPHFAMKSKHFSHKGVADRVSLLSDQSPRPLTAWPPRPPFSSASGHLLPRLQKPGPPCCERRSFQTPICSPSRLPH